MKINSAVRHLVLGLPLAAALTAATPPPAADPVNEVSCGPMSLEKAQQLFIERGKKNVQVAGVFGAAATSGAAHKHALTFEPGRDYFFIECVYIDDEAMTTNTGYNIHLKVTDTKKNNVLSQGEAKETGGGRTIGTKVNVKRSTPVEIEYDYTANGPDQAGNCLTLMVISQPEKK